MHLELTSLWAVLVIPVFGLATNVALPSISSQPSNASQLLDRRLASFSIEMAYLPSFTGNKSNPNTLTAEIMQRLVERTGVGPDIRPGGITMSVLYIVKRLSAAKLIARESPSDSSTFDPNSTSLVNDESTVSFVSTQITTT